MLDNPETGLCCGKINAVKENKQIKRLLRFK